MNSKENKSGLTLNTTSIEAFIRGDMSGFREVYAAFRQRVLSYCLYFMGERNAAEDAFQEVFIRVYTHRGQLRDTRAITTWITSITRTVCLNMLRTSKFTPEFVSIDEHGTENHHFDSLVSRSSEEYQLDDELMNAISRLPEIYRDAFILSEFDGYHYDDIAKITGTNYHNAQVRVSRAKKLLREYLNPEPKPSTVTKESAEASSGVEGFEAVSVNKKEAVQ